VVHNGSPGRRLLNAPEQVHEHALAGTAPPYDAHDLAFRDLELDIVQDPGVVKVHAEVVNADEWFWHEKSSSCSYGIITHMSIKI